MIQRLPPAALFIIAGILIGLDQLTKALVRQAVPINTSVVPFPQLGDWFRITHTINSGAAFGMFQGGVTSNTIILVIAIIVSVVIVVYNMQLPASQVLLRLTLSLQLAGAVGNLIDRLHQIGVTDFIHFTLFGRSMPIFNIADASITSGLVVLLLLMLFEPASVDKAAPVATAVTAGGVAAVRRNTSRERTMVKPDASLVKRYEDEGGPIQLLLYWGALGATIGAIVGAITRKRFYWVTSGIVGGVIVALLRLRDDD